MITNRQKKAVAFCETWLKVKFTGNINNYTEVSDFLSLYLDEAKSIAEDAFSSYYSNFDW